MGDLGENRVTRGEEMSCRAKTGSAGNEIEIESWSFTGTDSRGQPYRFPEEEDGVVTDNPWTGTMAISGTVTVLARVNGGERQEKSANVTVVPRSWENAPVEARVSKVGLADLPEERRPPAYPAKVRDFGKPLWIGYHSASIRTCSRRSQILDRTITLYTSNVYRQKWSPKCSCILNWKRGGNSGGARRAANRRSLIGLLACRDSLTGTPRWFSLTKAFPPIRSRTRGYSGLSLPGWRVRRSRSLFTLISPGRNWPRRQSAG